MLTNMEVREQFKNPMLTTASSPAAKKKEKRDADQEDH